MKKRIVFLIMISLVISMSFGCLTAKAEDFPGSQTLNILSEIKTANQQIMELDQKVNTLMKRWYALSKTPAEVVALDAVAASEFKNMPAQDLSNVLGSFEAFMSTGTSGFMATHDDNFVKLLK